MPYLCNQITQTGSPCQKKVKTPGTSCSAPHGPKSMAGIHKPGPAAAAAQIAAAAQADPFSDPSAAFTPGSLDDPAVAVPLDIVQVAATRAVALDRSAKGLTATQLADRNGRGKFMAAEVVKTIDMWRKDDPIAPSTHPPMVIPVVEMAEDMPAAEIARTAVGYMEKAAERARSAARTFDVGERAEKLSAAQGYAMAAHQMFEFARQDANGVAAAGGKSSPAEPAVHRAQARKALKTSWQENGRYGGRGNGAAVVERLRHVDEHLAGVLAAHGQSSSHPKVPVVWQESLDQMWATYKENSKAAAQILATDDIDGIAEGDDGFVEADVYRTEQARLHVAHALAALESYVAHPDHHSLAG